MKTSRRGFLKGIIVGTMAVAAPKVLFAKKVQASLNGWKINYCPKNNDPLNFLIEYIRDFKSKNKGMFWATGKYGAKNIFLSDEWGRQVFAVQDTMYAKLVSQTIPDHSFMNTKLIERGIENILVIGAPVISFSYADILKNMRA